MEDEELPSLEDTLTYFEFNLSYASRPILPERNLMIAVLLHGVIDFLSPNKNKRWYKNAKDWFFQENDPSYECSFDNICVILDINPNVFRKNLLRLQYSSTNSKRIRKLLHLNPTSGMRHKIGVKLNYQP